MDLEKIVLLDGYATNPGDVSWEPVRALGQIEMYDRTSLVEVPLIAERIGDARIVINNKCPIGKATIDACPNLKCIAMLGTGYNVVDYEYAAKKGIAVMNVPGYAADIVAQFAVGLMLELCFHIGQHSDSVHAGDWSRAKDYCYWNSPIVEPTGKTAGIIGMGSIGKNTARILGAMNMEILTWGGKRTPEKEALGKFVERDELFRESDFVFLHCPQFPETEGIINEETIGLMKDGAYIINTSRGGLIKEDALAAALKSGKIAGAAMDVVSFEPIAEDNPLLSAPNCIITPHIAWASQEARQRIIDITADNIRAFMEGRAQNVVNMSL